MYNKVIYFDHNATSCMFKEARDALAEMLDKPLNPSSIHSYGKIAKNIVESARAEVSALLGLDQNYQVIFTSGGTEANNIMLNSFPNHKILFSPTEHVSIIGNKSAELKVDKNGIIDLEHLEVMLKEVGNSVVSVMAANNETGVIQPLAQIIELAHRYGAIVHSDACQVAGRQSFNVGSLDLDIVTISAHKFGGPTGIGALIFKKNIPIVPIMVGGGQEFRFRPGTQNMIGIRALGEAAKHANKYFSKFEQLAAIRNYIEDSLLKHTADAKILGKDVTRLPNTSNIIMKGVNSETQLIHFDTNGIALSAGAACSSGRVDIPHVQMAMGLSIEEARAAIRISIGIENTLKEAERFVELWMELHSNLNKVKKV